MTYTTKIISPKNEIKNKFLKFIENDKLVNFHPEKDPTISFTSYHKDPYDKGLVELYYKYLDPYIKEYVSKYHMNCIWYQIYKAKSGSFHNYHTHNSIDCHISGVYYLKLPNSKISTEFIINNTPKQFNVKDGDLILFDASIIHRSPPNTTRRDKIILSFNLDLS